MGLASGKTIEAVSMALEREEQSTKSTSIDDILFLQNIA